MKILLHGILLPYIITIAAEIVVILILTLCFDCVSTGVRILIFTISPALFLAWSLFLCHIFPGLCGKRQEQFDAAYPGSAWHPDMLRFLLPMICTTLPWLFMTVVGWTGIYWFFQRMLFNWPEVPNSAMYSAHLFLRAALYAWAVSGLAGIGLFLFRCYMPKRNYFWGSSILLCAVIVLIFFTSFKVPLEDAKVLIHEYIFAGVIPIIILFSFFVLKPRKPACLSLKVYVHYTIFIILGVAGISLNLWVWHIVPVWVLLPIAVLLFLWLWFPAGWLSGVCSNPFSKLRAKVRISTVAALLVICIILISAITAYIKTNYEEDNKRYYIACNHALGLSNIVISYNHKILGTNVIEISKETQKEKYSFLRNLQFSCNDETLSPKDTGYISERTRKTTLFSVSRDAWREQAGYLGKALIYTDYELSNIVLEAFNLNDEVLLDLPLRMHRVYYSEISQKLSNYVWNHWSQKERHAYSDYYKNLNKIQRSDWVNMFIFNFMVSANDTNQSNTVPINTFNSVKGARAFSDVAFVLFSSRPVLNPASLTLSLHRGTGINQTIAAEILVRNSYVLNEAVRTSWNRYDMYNKLTAALPQLRLRLLKNRTVKYKDSGYRHYCSMLAQTPSLWTDKDEEIVHLMLASKYAGWWVTSLSEIDNQYVWNELDAAFKAGLTLDINSFLFVYNTYMPRRYYSTNVLQICRSVIELLPEKPKHNAEYTFEQTVKWIVNILTSVPGDESAELASTYLKNNYASMPRDDIVIKILGNSRGCNRAAVIKRCLQEPTLRSVFTNNDAIIKLCKNPFPGILDVVDDLIKDMTPKEKALLKPYIDDIRTIEKKYLKNPPQKRRTVEPRTTAVL